MSWQHNIALKIKGFEGQAAFYRAEERVELDEAGWRGEGAGEGER